MRDVALRRKKDEDLLEYKIRICSNRDIYSLTWEDVKDILNEETGNDYGESTYRKWWTAFKQGIDYANEKHFSEKEILNELELKRREFEQEKIRFQDQRREYMKLLRNKARIDHLRDVMVKAIQDSNEVNPLFWREKINYDNSPDRESALLISDWHKGLFTSNYWNHFDNDEFYRRLNRLTELSIEFSKQNKVRRLHAFQLGDLVHGTLHRITRVMDTEDVITQVQSVSEALAGMLTEFANEFEEVVVYNARGNHERISANKNEEIAKESLNDLIPWYLKARLSNIKNIKIMENKYDDEIIVADILGYKIFGVHGHRDNLNQIVQNLTLMTKVIPNYIFSGHIHRLYENEVHMIEHIANSSLSGVDDHAKEIRVTSKPAQKLIIFDKDVGRLCVYPIRLDK